jgi:hypothetical protein
MVSRCPSFRFSTLAPTTSSGFHTFPQGIHQIYNVCWRRLTGGSCWKDSPWKWRPYRSQGTRYDPTTSRDFGLIQTCNTTSLRSHHRETLRAPPDFALPVRQNPAFHPFSHQKPRQKMFITRAIHANALGALPPCFGVCVYPIIFDPAARKDERMNTVLIDNSQVPFEFSHIDLAQFTLRISK